MENRGKKITKLFTYLFLHYNHLKAIILLIIKRELNFLRYIISFVPTKYHLILDLLSIDKLYEIIKFTRI